MKRLTSDNKMLGYELMKAEDSKSKCKTLM